MSGLGDLLQKLLGSNDTATKLASESNVTADTAVAMSKRKLSSLEQIQTMREWEKEGATLDEAKIKMQQLVAEGAVSESILESDRVKKSSEALIQGQTDDLLKVLSGQSARMQLEGIIGQNIPESAKITNAVFEQLGMLTNFNTAIQALGIASEVASIGQIDRIGYELRSYFDYSGLSQLSGFGYGQILSTVVGQAMQQELLGITKPSIPSPVEATSMLTRGIIDHDTYLDYMHRMGYSDDLSAKLHKLSTWYPQVQDWIRFAVRDVFAPDVVESAKLDAAFPEDIIPYAAKAGVDEETLHWYWRAHWQLPSPTQAFEMYHRGYLSRAELEQVLRAADYAPGYIDAYMGIAETPYTRVDARRMLEMGVLSDEEYIRAMQDIGYSEDKATKLLEFAKYSGEGREKDLSLQQQLKAYDLGLLSHAELMKYVQQLGYDEKESEVIIELHLNDVRQNEVKQDIKYYDKLYQRYDVTDEEYIKAMQALGMPLERSNTYLKYANQKRVMAEKMPTKAEILKWLKAGHMRKDEAYAWLRKLGYSDYVATMYIDYSDLASEEQSEL